ncbi:LamG domain-containing protein [Spirosoma pulveris]
MPHTYFTLLGRQSFTRVAVLFINFLMIACTNSDVTCDVSGPKEDIVVNLPFNGNTRNTACAQGSPSKPATSTGVTLTTNRTGIRNGAYQFNGTNSAIYLDSLNCGSDVTISCWIKADNFYQNAVLVYYGNPGNDGFGLVMSNSACTKSNKITLLIGSIMCDLGNSNEQIADKNWYHLTLLKQDKTFTLFVNGIEKLKANSLFNAPTDRLNIGATLFAVSNNGYFAGSIDDVRVYNRALTPDEIMIVSKLDS